MSIQELISIRDFLTSAMESEGRSDYWNNQLVNSIQAAIDESFAELTGLRP